MVFMRADLASEYLFLVFSVAMIGLILLAVKRLNYRFRQFVIGWLLFLSVFSLIVISGWPLQFVIPMFPILFVSILMTAIVFALSHYGRRLSEVYTLSTLIAFQGFRWPLELILHHWSEIGTIPTTMTWTGQNWDIVSGVVAILAYPFVNKHQKVAWMVNTLGFILLLNVLRVVVMSSPLPFAWNLSNPILLIGYWPYALIGPLFVGPALAGHIIVYRKLIRAQRH